MTKALIFDCDGTLTNSMPVHYHAWRLVLDPLGIEFTEEHFYGLAGVPGRRVLEHVAGDKFHHLEVESILQQREELFFDRVHEVQPITAVVEIVHQQHLNSPMAVASGSVRESVHRQLDALGIREMFGAIVAAEDTELHKPDPDVFLEAARRLDVRPEDCCVYEDSDLGIEAARRAGMSFIDVRPLY